MQRDGHRKSLWQAGTPVYPSDMTTLPDGTIDVVVVGGGITGLSTALELRKAGLSCLLAEAHTIGFGTTGGTTAHLNTVFDTGYHVIAGSFGKDNASLLADGAKEAMARIARNTLDHAPECGLLARTGYLFAKNEDQAKELDKLMVATREAGVPMDPVGKIPVRIPFTKAVAFPDQGQFHPARYIYGLAAAFEELGGTLVQHCRVLSVDEGDTLKVNTERGTVHARHLVYATHIPPGVNILHFRCAPYRSYAMAVQLENDAELPDGLVYDMDDPYHYYRSQEIDGVHYLIAGGEDHKTGHEEDTFAPFAKLEAHVREHFNVRAIARQWSSQYFEPTDGLPYIGRLPMHGNNMYVATGFGGNGMMYGTLASVVLPSLIVNGQSMYEKLFDPSRVSVVAGFANFAKEAADVVGHLVSAPFPEEKLEGVDGIKAGEGRVVRYDGRSIALHRDMQGALHGVNPACSHIKCTVTWNGAERSWDCPCHGARYSVDGEVLTAPARKPLQKVGIGADARTHTNEAKHSADR